MKSSMRTWESGHAPGCPGARRRADELGQASGKGPSPGHVDVWLDRRPATASTALATACFPAHLRPAACLAEIDARDEAAGRPVSVLNPRRPRAPPLYLENTY